MAPGLVLAVVVLLLRIRPSVSPGRQTVILNGEEGGSILMPCAVYSEKDDSASTNRTVRWTYGSPGANQVDFTTHLPEQTPQCIVEEFDGRCTRFRNGSVVLRNLQSSDAIYIYRCHIGGGGEYIGYLEFELMVNKREPPEIESLESAGNLRISGQTFEVNNYRYGLRLGMRIDHDLSDNNSVAINVTVTSGNGRSTSEIVQVQEAKRCVGAIFFAVLFSALSLLLLVFLAYFGYLVHFRTKKTGRAEENRGETNNLVGNPQDEKDQLEKEVQTLKGNLTEKDGALREMKEQCDSLEAHVQKKQQLQIEKDQLEQKVQSLEGRLLAKDGELGNLKEQYESRKVQVQEEHDDELRQLRAKLRKDKDELEAELNAEFKGKKVSYQERIDELERNLGNFRPYSNSIEGSQTFSLREVKQRSNKPTSNSTPPDTTSSPGPKLSLSHPTEEQSLTETPNYELGGDGEDLTDGSLKSPSQETASSEYGDTVLSHEYGCGSGSIDFRFPLKGYGLEVSFYTDEDKKYKSYSLRITKDYIYLFLYDSTDPIKSDEYRREDNMQLALHGVENQLQVLKIGVRGDKLPIFSYPKFSCNHCFGMVIRKCTTTCQIVEKDIILQP